MEGYTYREIAEDFGLWSEYVDPMGTTSEDEFEQMSIEEKIKIQIDCFGEEEKNNG